MDETSKTKQLWSPLEHEILKGKGIDIGCGLNPIFPDVRRFDIADGDANHITQFVSERFDYVFSSHCLEHMHDPRQAILEWWQLVKPGGHLIFIVPDEDLYEQGVFPSRFNPDHKATFTISKSTSWSPVSINVLDLAHSLPGGRLINCKLQDSGYDRTKLTFGPACKNPLLTFLMRAYCGIRNRSNLHIQFCERALPYFYPVDQTMYQAVAQIQCIIQKIA